MSAVYNEKIIEMCKVRITSVPANFKMLAVYRKDVPSTINNRYWPSLPVSTSLQVRKTKIFLNKEELKNSSSVDGTYDYKTQQNETLTGQEEGDIQLKVS